MSTRHLEIDSRHQQLYLWETSADGDILLRQYPVSTSSRGLGEIRGSYQTPRGRHRIADKIGAGAALFAAFRGRVPTGQIWTPALEAETPGCDWILTRILWLDGLEAGRNQGGEVDTHARYIYLHGTHEEHKLGKQASHGCVRMKNRDIAELFDLVEVDTEVMIS
jgi:hypothetical protein